MYPFLANIALDPTFLVDLIVLLFLEFCLLEGEIDELDRILLIELIVTLVAPKVLVVAADVKVTVTSNSLTLTIHSVAEENGRFKQKLFTTAKCTGSLVLTPFLVFRVQFRHHLLMIGFKFRFELLGHIEYNRSFFVIRHGIVESQIHIISEVVNSVICTLVQPFVNSTKVHRLLDDFKIVRQSKFNRIDRAIEHPTMLVLLKAFEHLRALGFEFGRRKLCRTVQRSKMRLQLLHCKTIEQRPVLRFPS